MEVVDNPVGNPVDNPVDNLGIPVDNLGDPVRHAEQAELQACDLVCRVVLEDSLDYEWQYAKGVIPWFADHRGEQP